MSTAIFYIVILLLAIFIVIAIIKKAFKLFIFIIVVILCFVLYDVFVRGVSPIDEFNGIKTDGSYVSSLADYTVKIKDDVNTTKKLLTESKIDATVILKVNQENALLHSYIKDISDIKHTKRMDSIDKQYFNYLKTITDASDGVKKVASESGNIADIQNKLKGLNNSLTSLTNLNLNKG
ncbi:MAG TPA: hypothetical protein VIK72_03740 [Clostridiaceae bacterium]